MSNTTIEERVTRVETIVEDIRDNHLKELEESMRKIQAWIMVIAGGLIVSLILLVVNLIARV